MNKLKLAGLIATMIPLTTHSGWFDNEPDEIITKPAMITQIKCTAEEYTKFVDGEIELTGNVGWADNGRHDENFTMFLSKQKNRIKIRTLLANNGKYIDAIKSTVVVKHELETKDEDGEVIPAYKITENHWDIKDYLITKGVESSINIIEESYDNRDEVGELDSYKVTHTQTIYSDKTDSGYDEKEVLIYSCDDES